MCEELLGSLIAEVATEKVAEDKGNGFEVCRADLETVLSLNVKNPLFGQLFKGLSVEAVQSSARLEAFAKSFGYSVSVAKDLKTGFTPAA